MSTDNKQTLRNFIAQQTMGYELADDEKLFQTGLINSLFALQIVNYVEQEFNIKFDPTALNIKNFESINAINDVITAKLKQR